MSYTPINVGTAIGDGTGDVLRVAWQKADANFLDLYTQIAAEVAARIAAVNGFATVDSAHLTGVPTAPTPATSDNSTQLATTAFGQALITALRNSAPSNLDTLGEIASAIGNDPTFATTIDGKYVSALAAQATFTAAQRAQARRNIYAPASVFTTGLTVALADFGASFSFNGTSAATVALPAGSTLPNGFRVYFRNKSSFTLTFAPNGADTIDQAAMLAKQFGKLVWTGSSWEVIGLQDRTLVIPTTSVSATSATLVLPADYSAFDLEIQEAVPVSNSGMQFQCSLDGTTFYSGASDYAFSTAYAATGAAAGGATGQVSSIIPMTIATSASGFTGGINIKARITPGTPANALNYLSEFSTFEPTQGLRNGTIAGYRNAAVGRMAAIKFGSDSAVAIAMKYRLWGIR